jgi:hypothetical protein
MLSSGHGLSATASYGMLRDIPYDETDARCIALKSHGAKIGPYNYLRGNAKVFPAVPQWIIRKVGRPHKERKGSV